MIALGSPARGGDEADRAALRESYAEQIRPLLEGSCLDCHGYGSTEGGVSLDLDETGPELLTDADLWARVIKNVRAGIMPPEGYDPPTEAQTRTLADWVKRSVIRIDPTRVDPGPVTLRRLNLLEYRNSVRELTGVDYNTQLNFPPDDTGEGFDTVGDALLVSPLLLEKYLRAADEIVRQAIPNGPRSEENAQQHERFFAHPSPPEDPAERHAYLRRVIEAFASKAFRRPVDPTALDRLVAMAEASASAPGHTFEQGVAQAARAVLASPQFLFRYEAADPDDSDPLYPRVDQHTLAGRLSYFLWASAPDDELRRLADEGRLREQLTAQVDRMLADKRADASLSSFVSQWLRARDVMHTPVNKLAVAGLTDRRRQVLRKLRQARRSDAPAERVAELRDKYNGLQELLKEPSYPLRKAMRREAEMLFSHVAREDRSVLELIDADYTFLNEPLAEHYGVPGVEGDRMRRVELPADSPRGGVLTLASTLVVTSNPTRTSPVKRGLFVLDNLLGTPPPPPPPDIPELEAAAEQFGDRQPTLRELLAAHRDSPLCSACHQRMDPIGLALENFDALGQHRTEDNGAPIDPSGVLVSGERFAGVEELKAALAGPRRRDFYRCLTEKLFVYALGRSVRPEDLHTIDQIVDRTDAQGGRFRALLDALVESPQFQRIRRAEPAAEATAAKPTAAATHGG
ncbi:DUF1592 domain-containing protein [Botrimarina sp.]|uniref:DUF1592 domain-containing protein n=1 Tax=Botrimarina sp. TaxID=2795802 RepID=UPI0032EC3766